MKPCPHILIFLCLFCFWLPEAAAQRPTEYEVKAAFLYNFTRFIEWPSQAFESPDSPFVIGIFGTDPFGRILDQTVRDTTLTGRPLTVVRLTQVKDLVNCHILFISPSEKNRLPILLAEIEARSILTVGESDGFCQSGGILNFVLRQNRVRFEINPDAAERAQLKISSRLMRLAQLINDPQSGEAK